VGAILALLIFRLELTVVAIIGIILLIGIVKKNAIMMIDFGARAERSQVRVRRKRSISLSAALRPIMMPTMAASG